jgi:hypothetical protein
LNNTGNLTTPAVALEEIERRIEEYRRLGWERRGPAHVVYHNEDLPCPWPDCEARIAGIDFQLDKMGSHTTYERLLSAWWQGPGLVGHCPKCGRPVLFGLQRKEKSSDTPSRGNAVLPDNWHQKAHIIMKPSR